MPKLRRDIYGETAKEFMAQLFRFEYCRDCCGDKEHHTPILLPTGIWLTKCLFPLPDGQEEEIKRKRIAARNNGDPNWMKIGSQENM